MSQAPVHRLKNDKILEMIAELKSNHSDSQIAEIINEELDTDLTKDKVRHRRLKLKPKDTIEQTREKETRKAETKEREDRLKDLAKVDIVIDGIKNAIKSVKQGKILYNPSKKKGVTPESVVVMMSDLHIGKKTESYDSRVFTRRLNELLRGILRLTEIQRHSYPIDELVILGLGDWVDGISIFPTHAWEVDKHTMEQIFTEGIPALSEFLSELSRHFKKVRFCSVRGNHGRSGRYSPDELNFDLILYEALELSCRDIKNLKFEKTWDWYQVIDVQGKKFMLTHGDCIRTWLNIPIYGITNKGMRWQGSLKEKWDYLCLGHFHTILRFYWNNFQVIGNGTFISDCDFAEQQLGMKSVTKQIIFSVHPKRGITWSYDIDLL